MKSLRLDLTFAASLAVVCAVCSRRPLAYAGFTCFSLFSLVTLYGFITGAASCGCFGSVRVNPWITFLAIDLPGHR